MRAGPTVRYPSIGCGIIHNGGEIDLSTLDF